MLFRTIYGPELESVYLWLQQKGCQNNTQLGAAFGTIIDGRASASTNLEDALYFLMTCGLVLRKNDGNWVNSKSGMDSKKLKMAILCSLRTIQISNNSSSENVLDPYFLGVLDQLFIQTDICFRSSLHSDINGLGLPAPCSEEKVNAWRRVLEYLGVGIRGYGGFHAQYSEDLVLGILEDWSEQSGPMQSFLENHFNRYLPWRNNNGDVGLVLKLTLLSLEQQGFLKMTQKQDMPRKSYLGEAKIKWISRGDKNENTLS